MLFLLLMLGSLQTYGATSEQVLKTAWQESTYLSQDQLRPTDSRNPIRNVEGFVSQTKDGGTETEVGFKFQFRSWPEWKMGRSAQQQQKILKESSLAWALHDRYMALLNYEINRQKLITIEQALKVSENYLKAQTLSLKAGKSTAKAYLGAKESVHKLKRIQSVAEQEKELARSKIRLWLPEWKGDVLEGFELLHVEEVLKFLQEHSPQQNSLSVKLANEEFEEIQHEYRIVKGRENQWVKGLEVSQTQEKNETKYKVELSIQIPGLGSDDLLKQKQNELILKKALKQKDINDAKDRVVILKNQILNLIDLYKLEQIEFKEGFKSTSTDSLVNSETRLVAQHEKLEHFGQQQEITSLFLLYLLESEVLVQNPDINYLNHGARRTL
ncbi:hypothetical protein D3C87_377500 [compost metagenome]